MRTRIGSISACLLVAACGTGTASGPEETNPTGDPGAYVPVYSFEELRSGTLDRIIHCAGPLFDPEEFDGYDAAFPSTRPAMVRFNVSLAADRFTIEEKVATVEELLNERYPAELPLLSITYTVKSPSGIGAALDEDVVEGKYDDDIRQLAGAVRTFHRPTFVRIASEFNGVWNNYRQVYYADSYRRIVDLFRDEGADSTIFMWNYYPGEADFPYEDWYPGDDYVDWWSLDVFSPQFRSPAAY
ncbi:MAG TPA: glycosyl hydrolase, partial [Longimicrobiales bacterium]|nr:glycosyl hydrolase [Longimicrobiales bacterium]